MEDGDPERHSDDQQQHVLGVESHEMSLPKLKLHILTAVTRPWNVSTIAASIFDQHHIGWEIYWHLTHENEEFVGGQVLKNRMLDQIPEEDDSWVYILDDDTVMHSDFQRYTYDAIQDHPRCVGMVFAQLRPEGVIQPELRSGVIDVGQVLLRREQIADIRIPDFYDGDGWWLTAVLSDSDVVWSNDVLSTYNALRKES